MWYNKDMSKIIEVHPENPQARVIHSVVNVLGGLGVIAYPTSSGYALGCAMRSSAGQARIRSIRKLEKKHNFTLMCSSISQASEYVKIDNANYRLMKRADSGKFTFILKCLKSLPAQTHSKRSTIGVRVASYKFVRDLLDEFGEPILSTSLILPVDDDFNHEEDRVLSSSYAVEDKIGNLVDLIIDAGQLSALWTTILDLTGDEPEILREGQGEFLL
ncbi:MAG: threonylcarbamoyl-AMP synthase [Candidatus Ancillula sp.]|jgi:tRNA threonylcarbamoyl adenosine modification protein (Sua5/YciO/YrdC/YwlC family)|nr:threonylcarbamoyl-AMP synthase [Candidatus Ancillula sp.]